MKFARPFAAALALLAASPLAAQQATPLLAQQAAPPPQPVAPATPPRLIVVISVDQFSADLFAEYRTYFRFGFARLLQGQVFPSGYQSHAATETCPGHSTILTGDHPARTGIIANDWTDFTAPRTDEDEALPGSDSSNYTVSDKHLRVPTLGEWMKAANPASRVVSISGKDRSAVMMGGHKTDEIWWWDGKAFVSYAGRTPPAMVTKVNAAVAARLAEAQSGLDLPAVCKSHDQAIPIGGGKTVGTGRFARAAGDTKAFRASPEFDEAILGLAAGVARDLKLGQGSAPDLLTIGASATDYVGHTYGTEGTEMCLNLLSLDENLGHLFAMLDATGVDYEVMLTADHGGHDLPERNDMHGAPMAERVDPALAGGAMGKVIGAKLGLTGPVLRGGPSGDLYIVPGLTPAQHAAVIAETVKAYSAHRQVAAIFTRDQIAATAPPKGPPETWTLIERARDSYDPQRSGDFVIALKPRVTPIVDPTVGYVATHGSFWDYDRRVPIVFWRKGMTGFEQPLSVETVDIAPTLAALIHVPVMGTIDGRCLDLDAGPGDTCR
jgi:predicted AlkP superfamily pyrophosphatase or phosphodiesterase